MYSERQLKEQAKKFISDRKLILKIDNRYNPQHREANYRAFKHLVTDKLYYKRGYVYDPKTNTYEWGF